MKNDWICKGLVHGTPRTYGDRKSEDIWRKCIVNGEWEGIEHFVEQPISDPVDIEFEFRVNSSSPAYHGRVSRNGPDLDTMIIGALPGIIRCRKRDRPTLGLVDRGALCRTVTASKCLVSSDEQTGFSLYVRPSRAVDFDTVSKDQAFSFFVSKQQLKSDPRHAVQLAAELANCGGFRICRTTRAEVKLSFAEEVSRNPLSADWLEAIIDGLGASRVGGECFFDGPPTNPFGYDDSVIFRLTCGRVQGLPDVEGLHISCKLLGMEPSIQCS